MDMKPKLVRQQRLSARRAERVFSERTDLVVGNQIRFFRAPTRFLEL